MTGWQIYQVPHLIFSEHIHFILTHFLPVFCLWRAHHLHICGRILTHEHCCQQLSVTKSLPMLRHIILVKVTRIGHRGVTQMPRLTHQCCSRPHYTQGSGTSWQWLFCGRLMFWCGRDQRWRGRRWQGCRLLWGVCILNIVRRCRLRCTLFIFSA